MIFWRSLSKLPLPTTFGYSLLGAFDCVAVFAEASQILKTMVVSWTTMVYVCGPSATALTNPVVSAKHLQP
jgi:hypothetical protein